MALREIVRITAPQTRMTDRQHPQRIRVARLVTENASKLFHRRLDAVELQ